MWIFGQTVRRELGWPGMNVAALGVDLIDEELKELRKEHEEVNLFLDSIEKSTRGISR